jgi:hypothetical protein
MNMRKLLVNYLNPSIFVLPHMSKTVSIAATIFRVVLSNFMQKKIIKRFQWVALISLFNKVEIENVRVTLVLRL